MDFKDLLAEAKATGSVGEAVKLILTSFEQRLGDALRADGGRGDMARIRALHAELAPDNRQAAADAVLHGTSAADGDGEAGRPEGYKEAMPEGEGAGNVYGSEGVGDPNYFRRRDVTGQEGAPYAKPGLTTDYQREAAERDAEGKTPPATPPQSSGNVVDEQNRQVGGSASTNNPPIAQGGQPPADDDHVAPGSHLFSDPSKKKPEGETHDGLTGHVGDEEDKPTGFKALNDAERRDEPAERKGEPLSADEVAKRRRAAEMSAEGGSPRAQG